MRVKDYRFGVGCADDGIGFGAPCGLVNLTDTFLKAVAGALAVPVPDHHLAVLDLAEAPTSLAHWAYGSVHGTVFACARAALAEKARLVLRLQTTKPLSNAVPNTPFVHAALGGAHYAHHDYDAAIADYSAAIALAPKTANYYQRRANAYWAKGDAKSANADNQTATDIFAAAEPKQ